MTASYRQHLTDLLRLAVPAVGTRLGVMAMGLTDTVVVGRHSTTELGYVALGWAPTAVIVMAGIGLLSGVQVLTARRIGEGRPEAVGAVLRRGATYAFWLGLAATLILTAGGPAFLRATGIEADLARGAAPVLVIFALSMIPHFMGNACSSFLEALGRPALAMIAMWSANLLNLALQLVLVPKLGAVGAAYGTLCARSVMLVLLIILICRLKDARAMGVFERPGRDLAAEVEQRRIGYGAGAGLFAESAAFSGMNIIAGWVGGLAVAGWAIVLNVSAIAFMVPLGVAAAASVLVARAHGADDREGVRRAGLTTFAVVCAVSGALSLLVWLAARGVAGLYTPDPMLLAAAAPALVLATLFFIVDGLQVVAAWMLRARADVLIPTLMQVVCYALIMLPLAWFLALPMGLGLNGVVWGVIGGSSLVAALLVARFWALSGR